MSVKKLTAQEVASKRFTPVRMREGYSMDEVDEFLEAVEGTISVFDQEIKDLTEKYNEAAARPTAEQSAAEVAEAKKALDTAVKELDKAQKEKADLEARKSELEQQKAQLEAALASAGANDGAAQAAVEAERKRAEELERELQRTKREHEAALAEAKAAGSGEPAVFDPKNMDLAGASATVARMLETAAKNHDEMIEEGQQEAYRIKMEAESHANEVIRAAQNQAEETKLEAESLKSSLLHQLEQEKRMLEEEVSRLRSFEQKAREELVNTHSRILSELQGAMELQPDRPTRAPATGSYPTFNS